MKKLAGAFVLVLAGTLVVGSTGPAQEKEKEKTLKGRITCAKCELKLKGFTKCATVFVLKKDGKETVYFFDPAGNRNEVFAGGYAYYPDNPTRVWSADELGKGIFYYQKELNDRFLGVVT